MNNVNKFEDFYLNYLVEKITETGASLVISFKLKKILNFINHEISDKLLLMSNQAKEETLFKFTLLDIDDKEENFDKFIVSQSNKLYDTLKIYTNGKNEKDNANTPDKYFYLLSKRDDLWNDSQFKPRIILKIGKLIEKLFDKKFPNAGKPGTDIESFVNAIKAYRSKELGNFKLVKGDDIVKYYNQKQYTNNSLGSVLVHSCMSYDNCTEYIKFYAKNDKVNLLILMSDTEDDKIIGRALIWKIDELDDEKSSKYFMDRIYYVKEADIDKFINYAVKNKWLYKEYQDRNELTEIVERTENGEFIYHNKITIYINEHIAYPYMDTMKYLYPDERNKDNNDLVMLSNKKMTQFNWNKLVSTNGGYEDESGDEYVYDEHIGEMVNRDNMTYSSVEGRYLDEEDALYSEYLEDYASSEYADNNWEWSNIMGDYIPNEDAIWIEDAGGFISSDYAVNHNFYHCQRLDKWYKEEASYSEKDDDFIPYDRCIDIFTKIDDDYTSDVIWDDEEYIVYQNREGEIEHYDIDLKDEFIQAIYDIDNEKTKFFKKEQDKDLYFEYKGNYYTNDLKKVLKNNKKDNVDNRHKKRN
jgi:hypothetical protein